MCTATMSGFVGDLSDQQAADLASFKEAIKDVYVPEKHEDRYLLRFLRARKWDLPKAEQMFRNTLDFRQQWRLDTIVDEYKPPQVLLDYFPWGWLEGLDNTGHVIEVVPLGNIDGKGLLMSSTMEEMIRYKIGSDGVGNQLWRLEKTDRMARETKDWQITVITDMTGLSTRHLYKPALKYFVETEKMMEDHYPELLHHVYIVNTPRIFNLLYNMVKHAFDPVTRAKFEIVSGDAFKRLSEVMPVDILPKQLGGPREYNDPMQLCYGGIVPEQYYKSNDDSYERVTVAASSVHIHRQVIERAGTTLAWDFYTDDRDINFGVYHVPADAEEHNRDQHKAVQPLERVASHSSNMAGTVVCDAPGVYHLVWDNSFSWLRKKYVNYKVETVLPDETA